MLQPVIIFAFVINAVSLCANALGIYCLHIEKGGNVNQRLLLQNLSAIEILKILNDYLSMTTFYCYSDWYQRNTGYLDIAEINILTVLFLCFILVTCERLACISLHLKYTTYVTKSLIHNVVLTTWLIGFTSGFFVWATGHSHAKGYFYLVFDVAVFVSCIITYSKIYKTYQLSKKRFCNVSAMSVRDGRKQVKLSIVPFLIITSFLVFNAIPDVIFAFLENEKSYRVAVFMWALGFLMDPFVYIYLNKKTRRTAVCVLRRMKCNIQMKEKLYLFLESTVPANKWVVQLQIKETVV